MLSVICALLFVLSSCDTNFNQISPIPDAPVSYTLNILRDAPQLMTPGNSVAITEPNKQGQYIGYSGLFAGVLYLVNSYVDKWKLKIIFIE